MRPGVLCLGMVVYDGGAGGVCYSKLPAAWLLPLEQSTHLQRQINLYHGLQPHLRLLLCPIPHCEGVRVCMGKLVVVRYHDPQANPFANGVTVPRRRWHTMPSAPGKTVPGGLRVHLGTIARCLHPPQRRQDPQSSGSPTTSQRWETLPRSGTRNVLHCGLRVHFQCHVVLL